MPTRIVGTPNRPRLLASRLWLLAAALGVATVVAGASIIHDTARLRAAAQSVAQATAEQVAALTSGRLELLALEAFAPVTPWSTRPQLGGRAAVDALVGAQHDAQQCACRDTLPVLEFFHYDAVMGVLSVAPATSPADATAPTAALLERIARDAASRPRVRRQSSIHLVAGPELGNNVVVTSVQYGETGAPIAVNGLAGKARRLLAGLFDHERAAPAANQLGAGSVQLDTLSLQITTAAGAPVFGVIGDDHRFRGIVRPHGPFEGLSIAVGLSSVQLPLRLFVSSRELWHLGVLTVCTVLVVGFAVGSSRRELLLARARSDFIAGVSHDLRMPLAQILIAGETLTLRRERDEADRVTLASSIVREARRLIGLIDNVMLFSRSGAVELRPRLESVSVDDLFRDTVDAVHLAVEDAKQTIDVAASPTLGVLADRRLIRQAMVNLVDNALKYGAEGQTIRIGAEEHSPSMVRLYVEDEGPGIPAEERARVFEPYERLSRDQTSERTGTGLGLAVVHQIVRVCQGRVWLEEAAGGGTRAVIELPATTWREPADPVLEPA